MTHEEMKQLIDNSRQIQEASKEIHAAINEIYAQTPQTKMSTTKPKTPQTDALRDAFGADELVWDLCETFEEQRNEARRLAEMYCKMAFDCKWPKPVLPWEKSTLLKTEQNPCANNPID